MNDKLRQPLALAVLFIGGAILYLWQGLPAIGMAGCGITIFWVTLGIASGYWVGHDGTTDQMVTELMRRIRERKSNG